MQSLNLFPIDFRYNAMAGGVRAPVLAQHC
jgi:hypothetical protein